MGIQTASGWNDALADTPENQAAYGVGGGTWNGTQTIGQTSGGDSGGNSNGGGGGGYSADEQAVIDAFREGSGFKIKELEQRASEFNARLSFEREQMERIGIPELQIKQRLAALQEQQVRAELGLAYLNSAADFAASDPFKLANFIRGAQANGQIPLFLQNLKDLIVPQQGTQTGQAPAAITMPTLETALGGTPVQGAATQPIGQANAAPQVGPNQVSDGVLTSGSATTAPGTQTTQGAGINAVYGGTNLDATVNAASDVFKAGADKLAVGALEGTTDQELKLLGQAMRQKHGDDAFPAFLQRYASNPVRQQKATTSVTYG